MKTQPTTSQPRALPCTLRQTLTAALLPTLLLLLTIDSGHAGSATWAANPGDNYWHEAANWSPQTVPDSPSDTATFATSSTTFIYLDDSVALDGITFSPGASAFTIPVQFADISLSFYGAGITNNSGIVQNFYADGASDGAGLFYFYNSATAGTMTSFTIVGGSQSSQGYIGFAYFYNTSTAGNASFTLTGGTGHDCHGGAVFFRDSASVGNATFTLEGGSHQSASGGELIFSDSSTAAQGTLVAYPGGGHASGSIISFQGDSSGGTARVAVVGNARFDISAHNSPGVTIGSLEGTGKVSLGTNNLAIGSNNLSTSFDGVFNGAGSVTKLGTGSLTLRVPSAYGGGTTVKQGTLLVADGVGSSSATGSGPLTVEAGSLAGIGTIAGVVTVGTGAGPGAVLSPGHRDIHQYGALDIQSMLAFNADATYRFALNSSKIAAHQVIANGVTISSGAVISCLDYGTASLAPGTFFTAVNNTAANPISGYF